MWMMGCGGEGSRLSTSDSFRARKLRPLIPMPLPIATNTTSSSTSTTTTAVAFSSCLTRTGHTITDHFPFHIHPARESEQPSKKDANGQTVTSRWNPTAEQLRALEELYDRGTRTPSAQQIQHITAQLRRYGKIEGKNVFYWFQNHKARERQKRRRQINTLEISEKKDYGSSGTGFEEESKNWLPPPNCSIVAGEELVSTSSVGGESSRRREAWLQSQHHLNHHVQSQSWNGTWHMGHHPLSPPTTTSSNNSNSNSSSTTLSLSLSLSPSGPPTTTSSKEGKFGHGGAESQTLELFPLYDDPVLIAAAEKASSTSSSVAVGPTQFSPYQFFQFLPVKN